MLAAVITAKDVKNVAREIGRVSDADLIELRLDYVENLNSDELEKIIKKSQKPILITCRKNDEGGLFNGSEEKRIGQK